jgi:hypothetical protein
MSKRPVAVITSEGKEYPFKMLTPRSAKAAWRPYSVELDYLAISWNQLHHNLSSVFTLLLRAKNENFAQAIWHSSDSDFAQRKMLRALIVSDKNSLPMARTLSPLHAQEILWILNQIDDDLRHKRNNALDAPLMILTAVSDGAVRRWVEAHFNPLNPRARPLRGKNLIQEFKDYTAHADVLSRYASQIWHALARPAQHPWPERPKLPQAHKKKRKTRRGSDKPRPHLRGA